MTNAGLERRTRLLLIRGGSAIVAVATVLTVWLAFGDEPSETVTAGARRETPSTVLPTTVTDPAPEIAVTPTSSEAVKSPTTSTEEPSRPCSGDAVVVTTETDAPSYPPGATVTARSTARNVSDTRCQPPGPTHWVFADSTGRFGIEVTSADLRAEGVPGDALAPGQSRTWTFGWNQRGAEMEQVPSGEYSVTVYWGSVARSAASFRIQE